MKYAYFKSYIPGDDDEWVKISDEEFQTLDPYQNELCMGNLPGDTAIEKLVWEVIKDRPDLDLRKSEINAIPDDDIIEIAIC